MPLFWGKGLHVFTINTDPTAVMDYQHFEFPHPLSIFRGGYVTVEFACLKCHTDETRDWALAYAEGIHSFVKEAPPEEEVTLPEEEEVSAPTGVAGWVWLIVGLVAVAVILAVGLIMALSPYVRRVVRGLFGRGKGEK